jgi:hypothetical protein
MKLNNESFLQGLIYTNLFGGIVVEVQYDSCGRMLYHPDFHENQGKKWSEEDMEYVCKFAGIDDLETLAMALGRTKATVAEKLSMLRKQNRFERYKNLNKYW